eukprot:m.38769 g.38769  ORF g.38769 m.38769 type:complete len:462 (-) comp5704_c0_seq1:435-1820(-)
MGARLTITRPRHGRKALHPRCKRPVDGKRPLSRLTASKLLLFRHVPQQVGKPIGFAFIIPPEIDAILNKMKLGLRVPIAQTGRREIPVDPTAFPHVRDIGEQPSTLRGQVQIGVRSRFANASKMHVERRAVKVSQDISGRLCRHGRPIRLHKALVLPKRLPVAVVTARVPTVGVLGAARVGPKPIVVHDHRVNGVASVTEQMHVGFDLLHGFVPPVRGHKPHAPQWWHRCSARQVVQRPGHTKPSIECRREVPVGRRTSRPPSIRVGQRWRMPISALPEGAAKEDRSIRGLRHVTDARVQYTRVIVVVHGPCRARHLFIARTAAGGAVCGIVCYAEHVRIHGRGDGDDGARVLGLGGRCPGTVKRTGCTVDLIRVCCCLGDRHGKPSAWLVPRVWRAPFAIHQTWTPSCGTGPCLGPRDVHCDGRAVIVGCEAWCGEGGRQNGAIGCLQFPSSRGCDPEGS